METLSTLLFKLQVADRAYYNDGKAVLSDVEYDALRDQVREAGADNPTVQKYLSTVGAAPPEHLAKVRHMMHMGSQNKVNTPAEFLAWAAKRPGEYSVSYKMDGSSVSAVYVDGKLNRVSSRGDGEHGSDITSNALKWMGLPREIRAKGIVAVRGEAILMKTLWQTHFQGDANPRNTGNGTIMRKSGENNQHITFFAFDADLPFQRQTSRVNALVDYGFNVVPSSVFKTAKDVADYYNQVVACRAGLNYEIDGLIVALDDLEAQAALGYSDGGTRPNGQIAWKFESASAETTVIGMTLTIGSTGAIIPTAQLQPVQIGGITVSNCLLNNFEYIRELGLNIGDTVMVERAGDVIPHIVEVTQKNAPGVYLPPAGCPCCGDILEQDGKVLKCVNLVCEGKGYQLIKNWVKKTGIKHLGDGLLTALYESGKVTDIPDLYDITTVDLEEQQVGQGRLGQSMAEKVSAEIDKTRNLDLAVFMGSLGIKFLGRSMAAHIGLASVEEFLQVSEAELATKPEMGQNKARDMKASILAKQALIERLQSAISVVATVESKVTGGMSYCFSGVRMTPDVKIAFEAAGHQEKSGVSAGLNFLVLKDPSSASSKAEKARKLGIGILSYDDFKATLLG